MGAELLDYVLKTKKIFGRGAFLKTKKYF